VGEDINGEYINIQKAINQVVDILNFLEDKGKNRIPVKVIEFFINNYDEDVEYDKIQANIPLKDQSVYKHTAEILTYITNKYIKQK